LGDNANPIQVNLLYDGTTMAVTFKDTVNTANTFSTSTTVDLASVLGNGAAYVGFTGADGGVAATQVISNFTFSPFFPASLKSQRTGPNTVVLSWPASSAACLQFTTSLVPPVVWTTDTSTNRIVGTDVQATITPLSGNKYFRLIVFP